MLILQCVIDIWNSTPVLYSFLSGVLNEKHAQKVKNTLHYLLLVLVNTPPCYTQFARKIRR